MPPAPSDPLVERVCGSVGAARRIRKSRLSLLDGRPEGRPDARDGQGVSTSSASLKRSSALEALLVDLGPQIHRGICDLRQAEVHRFCPTGLPELDAHLGGGFSYGRLSEICGAPSSGRTALALSLLAETLERGVLAAWIDLADAFDPASALAFGSDLEGLLWVRARSEDEALRSCERLLQTDGFELVILDFALSEAPSKKQRGPTSKKRGVGIRDVSWLRLARLAASTRTVLVVLSNASATGSRAELVLEMRPLGVRFVGPPSLLDALETTAVLRRHGKRPIGQEIPLRMDVEPNVSCDPDQTR